MQTKAITTVELYFSSMIKRLFSCDFIPELTTLRHIVLSWRNSFLLQRFRIWRL